jgi:RNA polymerase sigma-70 factor (ECF subfamily)
MERAFFDAAAERYSRRIFTFASYLLGDAGEAEDVTQEVLIKLWKSGRGVDADRLGAWLLTVTRNACTDVLRRRQRSAAVIPIRRDAHTPIDQASREPSPERLAAGAQLGSRILRALNDLAEPARSVVILREIQGLSYREIGDIMSMPINTLKVTLYRGRRRLRESLKEVQHHVAAG